MFEHDFCVSIVPIDFCRIGLKRFREQLWDYYRGENRSTKLSVPHNLTIGMIGSPDNAHCHILGGSEVRALLPFTLAMLEQFRDKLPKPRGDLLIRAGSALAKFYDVCRANSSFMPTSSVQSLWDSAISFNICFSQAEGGEFPKSHAFCHLAGQSATLGNPTSRSAMTNESLNGTVAILARSTHRSSFVPSVLSKYSLLRTYLPQRTGGSCSRT